MAEPSGTGMPDPIHQFEIKRLWPIDLFGYDASFTNSSLFMVIGAGLIVGFLLYAIGGRALVPTRLQSIAETGYEFIANMVRESMGEQGMKFFPLVFTHLHVHLHAQHAGHDPRRLHGDEPHRRHGGACRSRLHCSCCSSASPRTACTSCRLFVPSGVPIYVLPLVTAIEIISFLSRPISHAVRLFANMLAGHITLKVFAGFIIMLLGTGIACHASAVAPPARRSRGADRARVPGRLPAGLRLHDADLHVSQRRAAPWPLGFGIPLI